MIAGSEAGMLGALVYTGAAFMRQQLFSKII
jgi:hypothetical protein